MRPPWKRGSSWLNQNPPARVYRRRVAQDAAASTTNTGPPHHAPPPTVDPPPPSNSTGSAHRDAPAPVHPQLPPSNDTGPAHLAPAAPAPVVHSELPLSAPGSSSPPLRSHPSPHGVPSPASTTHASQSLPQQHCSTDADTTPRRGEIWRPKHKQSPVSPVASPGNVVPPRQSPLDVAAAATTQAHAAFDTTPSAPLPRARGTPSSTSTTSPEPSPPPSAPARRVTPPLPLTAPCSRGTTPSSRSGSRSEKQSPTSSSSSSSGATRSGTPLSTASSSSSTSTNKSYAGLLKSRRSEDADSKLRDDFFDFLKKFTIGPAKAPYYIAQVAALKVQDIFKLEVRFEHLLAHNVDLAIAICEKKERASEFMLPVVRRFLFEEKLSDDRDEIFKKSEVSFHSMPSSIKYMSDYIMENAGKLVVTEILAEKMRECIATDRGMMVVQRSAAEVFRGHALGLSWGGDFGLKDMVLLNEEEVRIVKPPVPGGSFEKVKDVHRLSFLFMPSFWKDGRIALYFNSLQEDLENATEKDVTEEWFIEYILGHPGLRPSVVRYNLLDGAHQSCKRFSIPGSKIKEFLDQLPSWSSNWRSSIPSSTADPFHKIYWYKSEPGDGVCQPFDPTNGGILSFKRHFTRHADLYLKVKDLSEVEKVGATKFQKALPGVLRQLLRDCQMHKRQPLLEHWKPYRDVRLGRDGHYHRDGVIGVYPTFW